MSGFGSQPYGASPYGLGTPAVASGLAGKILRDTSTGASFGSRKIDPLTKDYVLDENGRILGMSSTQQLVYLATSTTKGSSAMRSLGHELATIDRITANFLRRADNILRAAVQHLVNRGLIRVIGIRAQVVKSGVVYLRFRWRDISTGEEDDTPVGGALSPRGGANVGDSLFDELGDSLFTESGGSIGA